MGAAANSAILSWRIAGSTEHATPPCAAGCLFLRDAVFDHFIDGTAFNLSSNARMVLNEFVYDPNGTSNSTLFSLTKGTFTFIAGKVAKTGDMKIDTPVATMGIRGTTPHVEISDDGTVRFSTLIEENKAKVTEKLEQNKREAPAKQRQAAQSSSRQQAESNLDKNFDINVKICRGC